MSKSKTVVQFLLATVFFVGLLCPAQAATQQNAKSFIKEFTLKADTSVYYMSMHKVDFKGEDYLYFYYENKSELVEITVYPYDTTLFERMKFLASSSFTVEDSLRNYGSYFRGKIRFKDLSAAEMPSIPIKMMKPDESHMNLEYKLLPIVPTAVYNDGEEYDIYLEEEKVIELDALNLTNIKTTPDWVTTGDVDYQIFMGFNTLMIKVKARKLGNRVLTFTPSTVRPTIDAGGKMTYMLDPVNIRFNVKPTRLEFVNPDKKTVYFNENFKYSDEIQLDFSRNLSLNRTYRIEDQQGGGGNLIAEIFTQSLVGNQNKILCKLRTFALHREVDGYLYIKEADRTRLITNFNIIEKPRIDKVTVLHDGGDWTENLSVSPGEHVEVKIEGKGLKESAFHFDGVPNALLDTSRLSEEASFYVMQIPLDIPKKKVGLFMNKVATKYELQVKEYLRPANFDFIYVNYGGANIPLSSEKFYKPVLYSQTIDDINILFNNTKIDEGNKLNGKQYIEIEVRMLDSKSKLIELQKINNVVVCPGENSPRYSFYSLNDCNYSGINLNDYVRNKTYDLEPFSEIEITISHKQDKYSQSGFTRKVRIIQKRRTNFDIQVSFPAGLLVKKFNTDDIGNLSGISISMLAQMSFYDPERIGRMRPYNIGAGFIGLNAFNFSENSTRDIGVVALASLNPINRNAKFSIPIYGGGGYFLKEQTWFLIFGPGIRLSF